MSDDSEMPSIGDCRDGDVLVCMGDDRPDQWAGWLEELVDEFNSLREVATAHDLACWPAPGCNDLGDWSDFCTELGVNLSRQFWEGSMVSGQFVMGWVKKSAVGAARKRGHSLVKKLRRNLVAELKARGIQELKGLQVLDEVISRTQYDRDALLEEVSNLQASLAKAKAEASHLQGSLNAVKEDAGRVAGLSRFVLGVVRGGQDVLIHGPLLRWSDGTILGLTKRGSVVLPNHSPHWPVLQELRGIGHPVVEVSEVTILGGWLSGPVYLQGSGDLSGWDDAWTDRRQLKRKFEVADPSKAQMLELVRNYLGGVGSGGLAGSLGH